MRISLALAAVLSLGLTLVRAEDKQAEPIVPKGVIKLFNGKDLTGLHTWVKDTGRQDPRKVFTVHDGMIHVSGEANGYVSTDQAYKDYHVTVEYKWGQRTDGRKYVRNSGLLLNAVGPDGGAGGTWMSCFECQLAQGCVGDIIIIRGKDEKGETIPVRMMSDIAIGPDNKPRWKHGGTPTAFTGGRQLWWSKHEPFFKELLDTRGKDDLESALGAWTTIDCWCVDNRLRIAVNGTVVNEAYDVFPSAGKILLQSEGFEVYFRNFEIRPAKD